MEALRIVEEFFSYGINVSRLRNQFEKLILEFSWHGKSVGLLRSPNLMILVILREAVWKQIFNFTCWELKF
jgi:hypothetical protein